MRLSGTKATAIHQYRGLGSQLWDLAGVRPSLDLPFADQKSLIDATTGSNLVDFTRASSGTYVGSDGLIKTATTNLLLRSEEFDQSSWVAPVGVTVTANAEIAPNGTLTADRVQWDAANKALSQSFTGLNGVSYALSMWVKGAAGETIRFGGNNIAADNFTLTGQWQRLEITGISSSTSLNITINTFGGVTARDLYVWGAQLEQSSTVGEYIPTTSTINSAPRFDHDPTTGESLGLLVEESRANLLQYSEDLTDPYWGVNNLNGTITANQAAAPDGTITANLYTEDNTTNGRYLSKGGNSWTSGTSYTVSVWAKQASGTRYAGLILPATAFGIACQVRFTLSGSGSYYIGSSGTGTTASIQQFPNGWYRCSLTSEATVTTTTGGVQLRLLDDPTDGSFVYTGDGTSGIYLWGAQLEVGSFPTSYIPTTGSTVTRAADVASIEGANFSSWYRQDEGSAFVDFTINGVNAGNNFTYDFSNGTTDEEIFLNYQDTGNARWVARIAGVQTTQDQNGAGLPRFKHAFGMASNNYMVARDGILSTGSSQVGMPSNTSLRLGARFNDYAASNGTIRRLTYWPTRLPDSTLQPITQ